ncbi:MAG: LysR substrate-binding domain-containing protein [Alphaproteobacteria bacterium]
MARQQMKEYTDLYPDIQVTLLCEDRELDLTLRQADAAIRFHPAKNPDLVQKSIMTLRNSLYASNDYLRLHGVPQSINDLRTHRLLALRYRQRAALPRDQLAVRDAAGARAGAGAVLPRQLAARDAHGGEAGHGHRDPARLPDAPYPPCQPRPARPLGPDHRGYY